GDDELDGGEGADSIAGGAGNDFIDGGYHDGAIDTLAGGLGDDWYILNGLVADVVVEAAASGDDGVTTLFDYTLAANVENLVLSGEAGIGTGNASNNSLRGNLLDNVLSGLAGNDVID